MINAIFALLCGGAVFAYLYSVCDCGFQQSQWIFVIRPASPWPWASGCWA